MKLTDIMTRDVITLSPEDTVEEIAQCFLAHRISAAPVVNKTGDILGIVSEGDLMRRSENQTLFHDSWWLDIFSSARERVAEFSKYHGRTARDVMTADVVTVTDDATAEEAARLLATHGVKRVPVLNSIGKLVGIVSRANLLHGLAYGASRVDEEDAQVKDHADATQAARDVVAMANTRSHLVNVIVDEPRVELFGAVDTDAEKDRIIKGLLDLPGIEFVDASALRSMDITHLPVRG